MTPKSSGTVFRCAVVSNNEVYIAFVDVFATGEGRYQVIAGGNQTTPKQLRMTLAEKIPPHYLKDIEIKASQELNSNDHKQLLKLCPRVLTQLMISPSGKFSFFLEQYINRS